MLVPRMHMSAKQLGVLLVVGIAATGCRSTRNTVSSWPGMGWMASHDEEVTEEWSDGAVTAGPPKLPARDATPQIASRDAKGSASRAAVASDSAKASDGDYPNTGYENPYTASNAQGVADRYKTGRYSDRVAGSAPASKNANSEKGNAPQRGFYGEDYGDEESPAESATARVASKRGASQSLKDRAETVEEAADDELSGASERATSRFSQAAKNARRAVAAQAATIPDAANDEDDTSAAGEETSSDESANELVENVRKGYRSAAEEFKGQLRDGARSVGDATRQTGREVVENVGRKVDASASRAIGRVAEAADEALDGAEEAAESASDAVNEAAEEVEQVADAEESEAGRGYSRFRSRFNQAAAEASEELAGPAEEETASTEDSSGETAEATDSEPKASEAGRGARTNKPWRPGSTGTYSRDESSATTSPSGSTGRVAPATYRETQQPRLSPAFR